MEQYTETELIPLEFKKCKLCDNKKFIGKPTDYQFCEYCKLDLLGVRYSVMFSKVCRFCWPGCKILINSKLQCNWSQYKVCDDCKDEILQSKMSLLGKESF